MSLLSWLFRGASILMVIAAIKVFDLMSIGILVFAFVAAMLWELADYAQTQANESRWDREAEENPRVTR